MTKAIKNSMRDNTKTVKDFRRIQGRFSPRRILAITISGIFLAEVIAMVVIYPLEHWSYYQRILLDATIMTVIIFPLLYFLFFTPLLEHIQQRYQADRVIQTRLRLMQLANTHTLEKLLQAMLDEVETFTGSTIGFFHFLDEDQKTLWLQAWSTNTLQNMCKAEGKGSHYYVDQAGVWADCIRQRQPVIHNDYASLPNRKGMPEGHALVIREMAVPIFRENKIVAILGVGNKPQDYNSNDVEIITTLADFTWEIVENKRAETALIKSEEKFRTLVDWTYDWEKWLDPQGNVVYMSPSCERITGYMPEEFTTNPDLLNRIVHPDDQNAFREHLRVVHDESVGPMNIEYRIIARDGSERWIEHVCRPLFGTDNQYLGRRISNRDITDRREIEVDMLKRSQKEAILTQRILSIQTDIARDLHDTIGQNISYLRMNLEYLSDAKISTQPDIQAKLQSMSKAANESYELIRAMLAVLQSGDSTDPLNLFNRYAIQVAERSSFQVEITSQGDPKYISPTTIRQLFFTFREVLNNIEKHALANRVSGTFFWNENSLMFVISDNGRGFDVDQIQPIEHYGLKFMRDRIELLNGSISIKSILGKGTTVEIQVPYDQEPTLVP